MKLLKTSEVTELEDVDGLEAPEAMLAERKCVERLPQIERLGQCFIASTKSKLPAILLIIAKVSRTRSSNLIQSSQKR